MRFTRNMIFAPLRQYRGKIYVPAEDKRSYRWVALLPDEGEPLLQDMVYVCRLSEALRHNQDNDCLFVCIYDRFLSEEEREDSGYLRNLIIMEENRSISWVLNLIQSRFCALEAWMVSSSVAPTTTHRPRLRVQLSEVRTQLPLPVQSTA